jgi:Dolichyl-phosphate-mannose-protein mannosyltransferase
MNEPGLSKVFRSRWFICLLLALVLAFNFAVRWRLRDMPLERDEGEYAYAGQLILQGVPPYELVYNMKFPGVYYAYALLMAVFGQSAAGIHTGMILVTSLSVILVFLIGRELFADAGGVLAAAIFMCLADLPRAAALAGHITHFVALFVCAGVFALLMARKKNSRLWWFASGAAFGLAILMSQQAVFFPPFILAWQLWKERGQWKESAFVTLVFGGGCVVPFLITAAGFACAGLWGKFIFWTFEYARQYVSIFPLASAPWQFAAGFDPVFESGIWVWFAAIVGIFVLLRLNGPSAGLPGVIFLAGLAGACPGLYFRNHYFIMAMPGAALLNAGFILGVGQTLKNSGFARSAKWLPVCLGVLIIGDLIVDNGQIWWTGSPVEVSRRLYGNNPFPEAVPIAGYMKSRTTPDDTIAVLGSEPELFFLSDRRSASGYIYIYTLTEPQPLVPQMRAEFINQIETARPKYVVFPNLPASWYLVIRPESMQLVANIMEWWENYSTNYTLVGAVKIYADEPSQFLWDEQLAGHPETTNDDVLIYCRKP